MCGCQTKTFPFSLTRLCLWSLLFLVAKWRNEKNMQNRAFLKFNKKGCQGLRSILIVHMCRTELGFTTMCSGLFSHFWAGTWCISKSVSQPPWKLQSVGCFLAPAYTSLSQSADFKQSDYREAMFSHVHDNFPAPAPFNSEISRCLRLMSCISHDGFLPASFLTQLTSNREAGFMIMSPSWQVSWEISWISCTCFVASPFQVNTACRMKLYFPDQPSSYLWALQIDEASQQPSPLTIYHYWFVPTMLLQGWSYKMQLSYNQPLPVTSSTLTARPCSFHAFL